MISSASQPAPASSPSHQARDTSGHTPNHALPSERLLRGQKTVEILHNGSLYKLQATKLGKLILTK